ncbi:MAG: sulfate adenylyltransferase subunit 1 [Desertimonas sp.]
MPSASAGAPADYLGDRRDAGFAGCGTDVVDVELHATVNSDESEASRSSRPLRIATAGSVDDGKSTLIGRLLHDAKGIFEDQLAAVTKASRRYGDGELNLALLTDGLRAEREQGITIDVAYRYVATPRRTFVIADTPGHAQYTRNMVTGASVSDLAIVLVDARHGVVAQTARHVAVASLLGVQTIVLAVNKMDLVDWSEERFDQVVADVQALVDAVPDVAAVPLVAVPVSALLGDNVVESSVNTTWYAGPTLLDLLETIAVDDGDHAGGRLAVQWVIRPYGSEHRDYRGFAGTLAGGDLVVGDEVEVLPSGRRSRVASIDRGGDPVERAHPGQAISVNLIDDVDAGRGAVLVSAGRAVHAVTTEVDADVCWMIDEPVGAGRRLIAKHLTTTTPVSVDALVHRLDPESMTTDAADELALNDLGRLRLRFADPIVAEVYDGRTDGGRLVLIDPATNQTAGAAMIRALS